MPKIYLFCYPYDEHDFAGLAIAEDGTLLAGHLSSSVDFSKHDMGFTSNWKHEEYKVHYPEGFELEWVDDPNNHEGLASANKLRKAAQQNVQRTGEQNTAAFSNSDLNSDEREDSNPLFFTRH